MPIKYEILQQFKKEDDHLDTSEFEGSVNTIELAMDEYAKRVAIKYAHWVLSKVYPFVKQDDIPEAADGLYEDYLKKENQIKCSELKEVDDILFYLMKKSPQEAIELFKQKSKQ